MFWLAIVSGAASGLLWILLVREIPESPLSFDFKTNFMLMAAFLSYPFNPSVVIIAAIGWLALWKINFRYAMVHLLLVLPLAFYFRNLSSPKYVILFILFYGIPASLLLSRAAWYVRACGVAAILFWWVVGLSNFGVFGPGRAALWYVPTADGPIPTGGYVTFYERAREGFYQAKQEERITLTSKLAEAGQIYRPGRACVRPIRHHLGTVRTGASSASRARIRPAHSATRKGGRHQVRNGANRLYRAGPLRAEMG